MNSPAELKPRAFRFDQDTLAFANELYWEYRPDPATGHTRFSRRVPAPTYAHRCFVMVRTARQFFYHARFAPEQPKVEAAHYGFCVREVVARSPRRVSADAARVAIPGYENLRAFSVAEEELLKALCGGAWQSYVLRSHWRMVLPISRHHQAGMASQLAQGCAQGSPAIVHLVRFPQLTINHGVILFGVEQSAERMCFAVYDPNVPARPAELVYEPSARTFHFPPNPYWGGGRVDVLEVYRGWFY